MPTGFNRRSFVQGAAGSDHRALARTSKMGPCPTPSAGNAPFSVSAPPSHLPRSGERWIGEAETERGTCRTRHLQRLARHATAACRSIESVDLERIEHIIDLADAHRSPPGFAFSIVYIFELPCFAVSRLTRRNGLATVPGKSGGRPGTTRAGGSWRGTSSCQPWA